MSVVRYFLLESFHFFQVICPRAGLESCSLYTFWGKPITSCAGLDNGQYIATVPMNKNFILPNDAGHTMDLRHLEKPVGENFNIALETLSERPRVFRLINFFTEAEANGLIENVLKITDNDYKLQSINNFQEYHSHIPRNFEMASDTTSNIARDLKRRAYSILGMNIYNDNQVEGVQIIRYNESSAYAPHFDYIETGSNKSHNWNSFTSGTNRFATIQLFLSDVLLGGETVFTEMTALNQPELTQQQVSLEKLTNNLLFAVY